MWNEPGGERLSSFCCGLCWQLLRRLSQSRDIANAGIGRLTRDGPISIVQTQPETFAILELA